MRLSRSRKSVSDTPHASSCTCPPAGMTPSAIKSSSARRFSSNQLIDAVADSRPSGWAEPAHFHLRVEMLPDPGDPTPGKPASQIVHGAADRSEAVVLHDFERIPKTASKEILPTVMFQMLDQGHVTVFLAPCGYRLRAAPSVRKPSDCGTHASTVKDALGSVEVEAIRLPVADPLGELCGIVSHGISTGFEKLDEPRVSPDSTGVFRRTTRVCRRGGADEIVR